ncbi:MAG: DUF2922 domain-containing protein [Clostridioides sp.]|jgi:hypothetical protein|nr:DUF2922 domain-containing protein [Clostridioides sp.]
MEVERKLVMRFKTDADVTTSVNVYNPRTDIEESEIKAFMDLAVAKGIFAYRGSDFASAIGAKIVKTDSSEYDLILE